MMEGTKTNVIKNFFKTVILWIDSDAISGMDLSSQKMNFPRTLPFLAAHLICFGVIWVGWSPTAVLFAAGFYFLRMFAITGFYHRYFSHKTFKTNRFWQFVFAVVGGMSAQRGALWWASHHRFHHRHSDDEHDIHSPWQRGFWWSHVGWITCDYSFKTNYDAVRDFAKYPELVFINRFDTLVPILTAVSIFLLGVFLEAFFPGLGTNGPQMLIWGFFISTIVLFHGTVFINSLAHVWGKKRYNTIDQSRNNFWLSLITLGEGWHNNHHRYPATVRQGFYWWEIDITYYLLKMMSWLGIVWDLKPVPQVIKDEAEELEQLRKVSSVLDEKVDFNDAMVFSKKSREDFKRRRRKIAETVKNN